MAADHHSQLHDTSLRGLAAMLLLAVMWGLSIPITKLGLLTLPPLALTALRFAIAVPILLPFAFARQSVPWRKMPRIAALGFLGIGVGQVAQTYGVAGSTASVGTIISATIPLLIVVFAAIRLGQRVSTWQRVGLLAAFAGIALVAFGGNAATLFGSSAAGVAWMLISSVAIAFYYVWSVELSRDYGTVALAAWSTFFGLLALLPWAILEAMRVPIHITMGGLASASYLGIIVTVAGLLLWLNVLRNVPARIAASVQYIQPLIGVATSAAIFGDRLGPLFVAGVVLVMLGLALTMSRSK
jgi:drug/metabolite transporter (DMT)-like permease